MIGVSDAAPPRAVNQPELAVDELSQICEGLARQRPEKYAGAAECAGADCAPAQCHS